MPNGSAWTPYKLKVHLTSDIYIYGGIWVRLLSFIVQNLLLL